MNNRKYNDFLNNKRQLNSNEKESPKKPNKLQNFLKNYNSNVKVVDDKPKFTIQYTNNNDTNKVKPINNSEENEVVYLSSDDDLNIKLKGRIKNDKILNSNKKKKLFEEDEQESKERVVVDINNILKQDDEQVKDNAFTTNEDYIPIPSSSRFLTEDQKMHIADKDDVNTSKDIPWMTEKVKDLHGHLKLHYEILAFYDFIKPTEKENRLRKDTLREVRTAIHSVYPTWIVKSFGSFTTNLHLPDSDIDILVLQNSKNTGHLKDHQMLQKIKEILDSNQLVTYSELINSSVPIIKAIMKSTNIKVDISVNRKNGYQAQKDIKLILENSPCLRPLIYTLKYYLRQRNSNEAYNGGISSFLLFNLVYAYVSYFLKTTNLETKYITLSHLLTGFFNFYGFDFDYKELGISIRNGGYFFLKSAGHLFNKNDQLCVENYQDPNHDIGKSCYNYSRTILKLFRTARDALMFPDKVNESFLEKIINIDAFLKNRKK